MASPIHRTSTLDLDQIEKLEQQALDTGNLALHEACRRVRRTRNALYLSCALTIIATVGILFIKTTTYATVFALLGLIVTSLASKKHDNAVYLLQINHKVN